MKSQIRWAIVEHGIIREIKFFRENAIEEANYYSPYPAEVIKVLIKEYPKTKR